MVSMGIAQRRPRTLPLDLTATPVVLALIVAAATAVLVGVGLLAGPPDTFADEGIYLELGRHLGASGRFEILGVPFPALTYGPAYVALLAAASRAAGTAREAYMLSRGLNAVLFSTAAVPAFFVAVRAISRRSALIVAAVAVALPAGAYTAKIMTESLAYPIVLWCVVAALRVQERPSRRRQAALLGAVLVAATVRFELLALGMALAVVCIVDANGALRRRLHTYAVLVAGTAVSSVAAVLLVHATSSAGRGAGAHGLDLRHFSIGRFLAFALGALGALEVYAGVLPFMVLVLVLTAAWQRAPWVSPEVRRIALVAVAGGIALLVAGSAYLATVPRANRPVTPADRYVLYMVPLVLVVFAAWLERGAIRPRRAAWIAAALSVLPVAAALVAVTRSPHGDISGLAFLPWMGLSAVIPGFWLAVLAAYGAYCAVLLARPSIGTHRLIRPVAILVALTSVSAFFSVGSSGSYSPPPGWLDAHSSPGVVAVWTGRPRPVQAQGLWEIDAANRNLAAVYYTEKADMFGQRVERRVVVGADGTLRDRGRPVAARYVLTTRATRVVGKAVAASTGFVLYRVDPRTAVRLRSGP